MKTTLVRRALLIVAVLFGVAACCPPLALHKRVASDGPARVAERYTTTPSPSDNMDSVATWQAPDGHSLLIATAKDVDNLAVFDGDLGTPIRRVGKSGTGLGEFKRPNGITVVGDLLFVVERDNHRVQVLKLPEFTPLTTFGDAQMKVSYGIWVNPRADGALDAYVTDSFQLADGSPPPLDQLDKRVHQFLLTREGDSVHAEYVRSFGETTPAGALRWVESILGDPPHNRMMIAEEHLATGTALRVYDMDAHYTGKDIGRELFKGQAEGIALYACPDGSGYWFATDQNQGNNLFQVFDRESLEPLGSFAGKATQNTDGIHMRMHGSKEFPDGVFYAVHDDRAVSAFDWRDIAKALGLRERCR